MLDRLPDGSRIAVIRLRSLGDCVLSTPAIALLKAHRPDLRIGVVVEDRFAPVFENNPSVEAILRPAASELRRWKPRLVLNLHGGTRSAVLTAASLARYRAGFQHYRFSMLYSHRIPRAQEILGVERKVHTAEHAASAVFFLGVPQAEIPRASLYPAAPGEGTYAVIHALAAAHDKTWPLARFMEVARHIEQNLGLEPVFVRGPGEPGDFGKYRVAPTPSVADLKNLMSGAQLFVGNDSGPAHVAAAFGVPSVVLFGPSDATIWAPWRTEHRAIQVPGGMVEIRTERVVEAVDALKHRVNA